MRSSSSESTASIAASISATQASAPRAVAVGVEARVEERDERAATSVCAEQRLLHVAVAERDPDLAQVARDRAQHRHLAPVELGAEDQAVEAVELGLAVPDAPEALVEALADRVDVDLARRTAARSRRSTPVAPSRGLTLYGRSSVTVSPRLSNIGSTLESSTRRSRR